jgi:Zn-dependent alcohol dehydrogenase
MVIDLYMDGVLPLDGLISRSYPLEEINEAFAAMNAGRSRGR